jgi:hypothetical protein
MKTTLRKSKKFKMPDILERLEQTYCHTYYDAEYIARGLVASRGDDDCFGIKPDQIGAKPQRSRRRN